MTQFDWHWINFKSYMRESNQNHPNDDDGVKQHNTWLNISQWKRISTKLKLQFCIICLKISDEYLNASSDWLTENRIVNTRFIDSAALLCLCSIKLEFIQWLRITLKFIFQQPLHCSFSANVTPINSSLRWNFSITEWTGRQPNILIIQNEILTPFVERFQEKFEHLGGNATSRV